MSFFVIVSIYGLEGNQGPPGGILVLGLIFSFLIPATLFKFKKLTFQDAIFVYLGGVSWLIFLVLFLLLVFLLKIFFGISLV